jgi:hypothetical protein
VTSIRFPTAGISPPTTPPPPSRRPRETGGGTGSTREGTAINHALHIAAVTQLRYPSEGRDYYQKKLAEGKTSKEAIRALKRRISDVVYRRRLADSRRSSN